MSTHIVYQVYLLLRFCNYWPSDHLPNFTHAIALLAFLNSDSAFVTTSIHTFFRIAVLKRFVNFKQWLAFKYGNEVINSHLIHTDTSETAHHH